MFENLLIEKYRPTTLDSVVLSEEHKNFFNNIKEKEEIPNLLFAGPPGTGKTTLSKIIIKDILDCQYLYINASDENGIDTIRSKITGFASTKSIDGKLKVVLCDECLHEDTLVTVLRDGQKQQIKICDVDEENDLVKTFNFENNKIEWRSFHKFDKGTQEIYEIEFENGEVVKCTSSHKWFVETPEGRQRMKLSDIITNNILEIISIN